jgi:sec-independent protein translocase protein TatA
MPTIGPLEIIIVLVVVILLFGVGRIGKIGGELGKSIREFRKGLEGDEKKAADGTSVTTTKPADSETKPIP